MMIEEREFDKGITPGMDKEYACYYCGVALRSMGGKLHKFKLEKNSVVSHALDIFMWCPECGLKQTFGIVLSEEQYNESKAYSKKMESNE